MVPINTATNETHPISDAYLRERYHLTKEYEEEYPEDFVQVLSLVRSTEEAIQAARASAQSDEKLSDGIMKLAESNRDLHEQVNEVIKSEKETTQALPKLAKSSSNMRAMTSNLANIVSICANRIFHPISNGFYFLTGHRETAAVLPGENPLDIEHAPENTTSHADPTNQTSGNVKKTSQDHSYFLRFREDYTFCVQESRETGDIHP